MPVHERQSALGEFIKSFKAKQGATVGGIAAAQPKPAWVSLGKARREFADRILGKGVRREDVSDDPNDGNFHPRAKDYDTVASYLFSRQKNRFDGRVISQIESAEVVRREFSVPYRVLSDTRVLEGGGRFDSMRGHVKKFKTVRVEQAQKIGAERIQGKKQHERRIAPVQAKVLESAQVERKIGRQEFGFEGDLEAQFSNPQFRGGVGFTPSEGKTQGQKARELRDLILKRGGEIGGAAGKPVGLGAVGSAVGTFAAAILAIPVSFVEAKEFVEDPAYREWVNEGEPTTDRQMQGALLNMALEGGAFDVLITKGVQAGVKVLKPLLKQAADGVGKVLRKSGKTAEADNLAKLADEATEEQLFEALENVNANQKALPAPGTKAVDDVAKRPAVLKPEPSAAVPGADKAPAPKPGTRAARKAAEKVEVAAKTPDAPVVETRRQRKARQAAEPIAQTLRREGVSPEGIKFFEAEIPSESLLVRPGLQFKKKGITDFVNFVTDKLKDVKVFDRFNTGPLTVWEAKNGKLYVVNGHHRRELAIRVGEPTLSVRVMREVDGVTEAKARAVGALQNIRDGNGAAIDAAAVMRELGIGVAELKKFGVSTRSTLGRDAVALSTLPDEAFQMVASGRVQESVAAGIADAGLDGDLLMKALGRAQELETRRQGEELGRIVKSLSDRRLTVSREGGLFDDVLDVPLEEMSKISDAAKRSILSDKRRFSAILKGRKAGSTVVDDVAQSEAAQLEAVASEAMGSSRVMKAIEDEAQIYAKNPTAKQLKESADRVAEVARTEAEARIKGDFSGPTKPKGGSGGSAPGVRGGRSRVDDVPPKGGESGEIKLFSGIDPIRAIKAADDLSFQGPGSFTVERGKKVTDFSLTDRFVQPLSIPGTDVVGSYERIAGQFGKDASDTMRAAQRAISDAQIAWSRKVDEIGQHLESVVGGKLKSRFRRKSSQKVQSDFIDLVERDFDDPVRIAALKEPGALGKALKLHDELTDELRDYIISSRKSLNIDMPKDWGITEQGYFRHLFLGDIRIVVNGEFKGTARTYAEAQKMAVKLMEESPGATIVAKARNMAFGDPTLRISDRRFRKVIGALSGEVDIPFAEIMKDVRGIIGRKSARMKFFGPLLQRKGAAGFSRDYLSVMRLHASQVAKAQELSKLNKAMQPIIEKVRVGDKVNPPRPALADEMEAHLDSVWGKPLKSEIEFGNLIRNVPILRNYVQSPEFALRGLAARLTKLQFLLKLSTNIKSTTLNALQTSVTMWPYVRTADFVKVLADVQRPSIRKMLREKGVMSGATKLEGEAATVRARAKTPFMMASENNRAIGYLYGWRQGLKKGLPESEAHKMGLGWAERVEFDNSQWNIQPILRSPGARVVGQFKSFMGKNIENAFRAFSKREQDVFAERGARVAKLMVALGGQGGLKVVGFASKWMGIGYIAMQLTEKLKDLGMEQEEAEQFADMVMAGAPTLIGQDLSGSVQVIDFFGRTNDEKIVNFIFGPTLSGVKDVLEDVPRAIGQFGDEELPESERGERGRRTLDRLARKLTPAGRQLGAVFQIVKEGPDEVVVRGPGGKEITLTPFEAFMLTLGFTPRRQTRLWDKIEFGFGESSDRSTGRSGTGRATGR